MLGIHVLIRYICIFYYYHAHCCFFSSNVFIIRCFCCFHGLWPKSKQSWILKSYIGGKKVALFSKWPYLMTQLEIREGLITKTQDKIRSNFFVHIWRMAGSTVTYIFNHLHWIFTWPKNIDFIGMYVSVCMYVCLSVFISIIRFWPVLIKLGRVMYYDKRQVPFINERNYFGRMKMLKSPYLSKFFKNSFEFIEYCVSSFCRQILCLRKNCFEWMHISISPLGQKLQIFWFFLTLFFSLSAW